MTDENIMATPSISLIAGLDRSRAWEEGGSVRYLVAELSSTGGAAPRAAPPALNLALAIDVSGSMAGEKIEAARRAARVLADALTNRDSLSIVAFDSTTELLLDARAMDEAGRAAARTAIDGLADRGGTNLFEGWLLAAERVAHAMEIERLATHRVIVLSDGQANEGVTDRSEIACHIGAVLERGVVTSAVGIGDGYDEELLGAMAEAGGGSLHDAAQAPEIGEVVLGELQQGRAALVERLTLRISIPANLRAEVVGAWSHAVLPGAIEVLVGNLQPEQTKRVVLRLHCPSGAPGTAMLLGVSAGGTTPSDAGSIEANPVEVELRLARSAENNAQPRDAARCLAVVQAWQADALRRAVRMNREGDRRAAKHFLGRELRRMESYARGIPGTEILVAELILVQRRVSEEWDERTRKEVFTSSHKLSRSERDLRSDAPTSLSERFR